MTQSDVLHTLLIFGSTFVLEDVAVLGAALLVVNSMVPLPWAAASSFAGIWLGDLGLYFLALHYGRPVFDRAWLKRLLGKKIDLGKSESWFRDHGVAAILMSRAVPGTRLPTYLAAGILRVPALRFLPITAAACLVWVAGLFWLSYHAGMMVIAEFNMFKSEAGKLAACVALAAVLGWLLRGFFKKIPVASITARFKRTFRWEFWPPVLFYIPVAAKYVQLALKYRSFSLPTLANPGMFTGGLIGESKYETLADLARVCPEFVPETHLIRFESVDQQISDARRLQEEHDLSYPLVFKPDVGQRGFAFKLIHSDEEARSYTECFARDTLVQQYAAGPYEAGIFYYRFPNEEKGKIFAITEKVFPVITGDGTHTVEELIRSEPRASLIAETYLKRFASERGRVLGQGESLRLVEAGNHCQGAIFLDGGRLCSTELERVIDRISRSIDGFFVGRYDIRYGSEDELRNGKGFQIIELNGASSEATSIYDPKNSLRAAYQTLFRQWEIIFEIGAQNRTRGLTPTPVKTIWVNWTEYRRRAVPSVSD
jgi:membrane protein DedA with SNARE-associated domain